MKFWTKGLKLFAVAWGAGALAWAISMSLLISHVIGSSGTCTTATAVVNVDEATFVQLMNQYRASNGAGPLSVSPALTKAAAWMAEDLAAHGYFSHADTLGRLPWDRAVACGYPSTGVGENIAGGTTSPAGVLADWQSSVGHNANMLNPAWRVIGVARVPGGVYGVTWVTDFGYIVDAPPPPPVYRIVLPALSRE